MKDDKDLQIRRIQAEIDRAMVRWAHSQAETIEVVPHDKCVTLEGGVPSETLERVVLEAVEHVPGVESVNFAPPGRDPERPWQ